MLRCYLNLLLYYLMIRATVAMFTLHSKCRGGFYPRSQIKRFPVPDDKVNWSTEYAEYNPTNYTASVVNGKPWADPEIDTPSFKPNWNNIDGKVNRVSYVGTYKLSGKYPQNPMGRTGITGRGLLGRWGPNHAADPVVTRWKRQANGDLEKDTSNKPILQCVVIKRSDTGEWALPGGMVDPGEKVAATAVREFQEEALNSDNMTEDQKLGWLKRFEKFFNHGDIVYQGYIDDPRNTDNSWMESVAYHFHDNDGTTVGSLKLNAGSDAVGVQWLDVTPNTVLYASHTDIIMQVLNKLTSK